MTFLEVFEMNTKTYDRLKYVVQIILPAVIALTGVLLMSFEVDKAELILTIMAAIHTFLGTVLGISNYQYKNQ